MICVIAKLPPDAVERLNALRETVLPKEQLVQPLHGHITVASFLPEDDTGFLQDCTEAILETPSFSVRYEKLEVLSETSVIVAAPSVPAELLDLHGSIAEKYSKSMDRWTCGADWRPHTTLFYHPDADLHDLCRKMQEHFIPFETRISKVEFSKVVQNGYHILKSVDLKRQL